MTLNARLSMRVNANARGHWRALAAKTAAQRNGTAMVLRVHPGLGACVSHLKIGGRLRVLLTRVANRELDGHDNLRTALKPCADGITDALGLRNDRDARIDWTYAQLRGPPKTYAVEISITRLDEETAA